MLWALHNESRCWRHGPTSESGVRLRAVSVVKGDVRKGENASWFANDPDPTDEFRLDVLWL